METDDEPPKKYPPVPAKMSKVPSWISLGFVLGVMFVWAIPKHEPVPELTPPPPPPPKIAEPTKLTTIEAVFEAWGQYAVWDRDTTEVVYWNPGTEEFSEFFEVRRIDDALYFRSIPKLTRRVINHGKAPPAACPLKFTETEEQYRDWQEHDRFERPAESK
jgi:hypothetical protein